MARDDSETTRVTPSTPASQSASSGSPNGNGSGPSTQTKGAGFGAGLDFGGKSALVLLGAGGLLAAALFSVGLFDAPKQAVESPTPVAAAAASLIRPIAAGETDQAIAKLMMSGAEKEKVRAEVADGKVRLGWITVSDNFDEDGDWISVTGAGFRQDVRLLHAPYTMAVPYIPGMPITVTGLVDGGGGDITVSVYVGTAVLSMRPLKPGEVLQISSP